jgi:Rrf2 family transcriptional regulator, cysteine metabolism repressor
MKISLRSQYALLAILDLATHPAGSVVKAAAIAERHRISRISLALLLTNLKLGGFVQARRGAEGGYRLAKPPEEITVAEVLSYMGETDLAMRKTAGPFRELWSHVDTLISAIAHNTTFAELARQRAQSRESAVASGEI